MGCHKGGGGEGLDLSTGAQLFSAEIPLK